MFSSQLSQKPIGDGLNFITGNKNKFGEADKALPGMSQLDIDLDEIQSLSPQPVLKHKIITACERYPGAKVVEDTSVEFVGCGGFPGPLIKWVMKAYPLEKIIQFASPKHDYAAIARVTLGYSNGKDEEIIYVTAEIPGKIVAPRGDQGFGWDPIFQPDNQDFDPPKTFGEMTPEEKAAFSMRPMAFKKLARIIEQDKKKVIGADSSST